jgi:hypothetical protein
MMAEQIEAHDTRTHVVVPSPVEVDAGAYVAFRAEVSCAKGCDLRASLVRVLDQDDTLAQEGELSELDGAMNRTEDLVVTAPLEPGEYAWRVVFPAQEKEGVLHEESSAPFLLAVKPHSTSMAVWDILSPIALHDKFTIKVGVKCSAECSLAGREIRIYGQRGKKVASAVLGGSPWPGTRALYWVEVELEAPPVEGYYRWRVRFPEPDLELPHEGSSSRFAFTTARPPQHVVTVRVSDKRTKRPLRNALVRLRSSGTPYKGRTDDGGEARVRVPAGQYTVYASKGGDYETFQTTLEIHDDTSIRAELVPPKQPWRD